MQIKGRRGYGIKDIENFNKSLLVEWKWILGVDNQGVWKKVLESKYGILEVKQLMYCDLSSFFFLHQ